MIAGEGHTKDMDVGLDGSMTEDWECVALVTIGRMDWFQSCNNGRGRG